MSEEQNTEARPTAQPISPMASLEQRHIDAASEAISEKIKVYQDMGWSQAQVVFLAAASCLGHALARIDDLEAADPGQERLLVVVGDCPDSDVEAVVNGGPVSNALVLYVRRWMAADHEAARGLLSPDDPPKLGREGIASEVYSACDLGARGDDEVDRVAASYRICEAAGWEVLADPCPF